MVCSCGNDTCEGVQDDDLHLCCMCAPIIGVSECCDACLEEMEGTIV